MGYDIDWNYPAVEFNLRNDIAAANVVFDSGITIWQVPATVYSMVSVGYAELEERIGGSSQLADYLIHQLVEWNATHHLEPIEHRSLGDSPAISLILNPRGGVFRTIPAPRFSLEGGYLPGSGHPIRVCESVDVRYLLEDMFAKIRRFGRAVRPTPDRLAAAVDFTAPSSSSARNTSDKGDWNVCLIVHPPGVPRPVRRGRRGRRPVRVHRRGSCRHLVPAAALPCRTTCACSPTRTTPPSTGSRPWCKKFDAANGTTTTVDSLPGSGAASTPTSCAPSCSAASGPDVWRIWGGQIGAPFVKAKQAMDLTPVLREVRLGLQDQHRGHRGHDLRRGQGRRAVQPDRYRCLVQQGRLQEGGHHAPCRPATPSSRRSTTSCWPPASPRLGLGGKYGWDIMRLFEYLLETSAGPDLHDKLLNGRGELGHARGGDRVHQLQEVAGQEVDPRRRDRSRSRPRSSPGTSRARRPTRSPGRGPRRRPSWPARRSRPTSASSSSRPTRRQARHSGLRRGLHGQRQDRQPGQGGRPDRLHRAAGQRRRR